MLRVLNYFSLCAKTAISKTESSVNYQYIVLYVAKINRYYGYCAKTKSLKYNSYVNETKNFEPILL